MGSVSAAQALRDVQRASGAPFDAGDHGTGLCSKVAAISTHPRLCLASAREVLRLHAKEVIYGAFPGRSRRATCVTAAQTMGVSADTIERLIEGETASPDVLILGYCARLYRARTGKVSPIHAVLAQVMAAGDVG